MLYISNSVHALSLSGHNIPLMEIKPSFYGVIGPKQIKPWLYKCTLKTRKSSCIKMHTLSCLGRYPYLVWGTPYPVWEGTPILSGVPSILSGRVPLSCVETLLSCLGGYPYPVWVPPILSRRVPLSCLGGYPYPVWGTPIMS